MYTTIFWCTVFLLILLVVLFVISCSTKESDKKSLNKFCCMTIPIVVAAIIILLLTGLITTKDYAVEKAYVTSVSPISSTYAVTEVRYKRDGQNYVDSDEMHSLWLPAPGDSLILATHKDLFNNNKSTFINIIKKKPNDETHR